MCGSCWIINNKGETMDQRLKKAEKKIESKLKSTEKVEKKEFKGLLKEDKKLDAKRDKLETAAHKMKNMKKER